MLHILLVEDDVRLASLIQQFLQANNFRVTVLHSGEQAPAFILAKQPDVVILDIMLPKLDGFSICRRVRKKFTKPILFLTAKDSDLDHVIGLEIGADDYIIKPVVPHVLLARINMVLRRTQNTKATEQDSLKIGQLSIDKKSRQVHLNKEHIELTSHEFELLWLLANNPDEPQSRDFIHQEMIGRDYDGFDRSVDVRVSRLRKKLADDTQKPYKIMTIWGKGYLFCSSAWQ
ncbi:MAG: response regulator transcription factor [Colwellia sp.]|uniref:response regulator transcription factor n=1 Tax=Colwellia sp. TaxID=56799 RepID=UPI001DE8F0EF|nr:response regulator transcription factor [Colwellia sp.]NQY48626.1 response regulator transcription factor [Colwellia sp.]